MIKKLKREALRQGLRLISHPQVGKWVTDPRLYNFAARAMTISGKVERRVVCGWNELASRLNLATKADIERLTTELRNATTKQPETQGPID
jgi:hypothetical protein